MERHCIKFFVHLDLPNGEAPGIPKNDKVQQKIKKALTIVSASGLEEYGFSASDMDIADDNVVGFVLTHEDA